MGSSGICSSRKNVIVPQYQTTSSLKLGSPLHKSRIFSPNDATVSMVSRTEEASGLANTERKSEIRSVKRRYTRRKNQVRSPRAEI